MKSKQLDIDARPICESGGGRMFAKGSVVSQPGVALKFAVRAQNQEFIKCQIAPSPRKMSCKY